MTAERLAIAGGPNTGKTTLAYTLAPSLSAEALHTDDLVPGTPWIEQAAQAAEWMERPGPWIIEGTTTARALRRFMETHPDGQKPCDRVLWLSEAHTKLTPGQARMTKGITTILTQIEAPLLARGVTLVKLP